MYEVIWNSITYVVGCHLDSLFLHRVYDGQEKICPSRFETVGFHVLIGDTGALIGQFSFQVSQLPLCEMSQPLMTPVDMLACSWINRFCLIITVTIKYCYCLLLPLYRVFTIIYLKEQIEVRKCYHSVQNLLSSRLLSKNLKIKICRTITLSVVLYGCETWSLSLRDERKLRVFENMVLRRIFGPRRKR